MATSNINNSTTVNSSSTNTQTTDDSTARPSNVFLYLAMDMVNASESQNAMLDAAYAKADMYNGQLDDLNDQLSEQEEALSALSANGGTPDFDDIASINADIAHTQHQIAEINTNINTTLKSNIDEIKTNVDETNQLGETELNQFNKEMSSINKK